jgi:predicted ATPase/Tfp pilus assembly protein PilF
LFRDNKLPDPCKDPLLVKVPEVEGYKVLGPCILYEVLGRGGMGVLYRGRHLNLDVDVAVKCLDPGLLVRDEEFVFRFQREARLAARMNHANVVRVYDVSESSGVHYLIMEYVEGEDARRRVHRKGPLPVQVALQVIEGAARGLAEAHRCGMVHRDIKPDNILISDGGEVKIADLGLAKAISSETGVTLESTLMGTPRYMPPEQWDDIRSAGPQADIWALGATLYFLLLGEDAIQGEGVYQVMNRLSKEPFPDIREKEPDVPEEVARIIVRATRRDPSSRYPTVEDMMVDIREILGDERVDLCDTAGMEGRDRSTVESPPQEVLARIKGTITEKARGLTETQETIVPGEIGKGIVPRNLPHQTTPFIGREEELAEIYRLLEDPSCRLLTLLGPGGIGKTRLAVQAASEKINEFPQGVYFVPLAPVSSTDYLVHTIADSIRFTFFGQEDPKVQLLNYLREKEMLLVMDNFEHLLNGSGLLMEVLESAPDVKLLVTSRERLNIQGEWVREVDGMDYPETEEVTRFGEFGAVQLYLQNMQRVRPGFSLTEDDKQDVLRVCQLVDGMPLGIELASAWGRALSSKEIAKEIKKNRDFLATTMRGVPERHQSIRAVFEHSWRFLSDEERDVFKKLSVFRGGFRREAAEKVIGASLLILTSLGDKSLLRWTPSDRYEVQELLRQYAEEKLSEDSVEEEKVRNDHCDYYAEFLNQREGILRKERQRKVLDEIGDDIENIREAWNQAIDFEKVDQIRKSLEALQRYYESRSRFDEGEKAFGRAVERLAGSSGKDDIDKERRKVIGSLLARHGLFSWHLSRYEEAREILQKGLEMLNELDCREDFAFCLNNLGIVSNRLGERNEAKRCYQESLDICREIGDRYGIARSLNNLGLLASGMGDYSEAKRLYREGLGILREIADQYGVARTLNNLGAVFFKLGEYGDARNLYEESLEIWRENGDRHGMASTLNNLGFFADRTGELVEAKQLYRESLAIKREIGNRQGIAISLINLGGIASKLGEYEEAKERLEESLAICQEIGDQGVKVQSLNALGQITFLMKEYQESKEHLRVALKTAAEIQSIPLILESLVGMAEHLKEEGENAQALEILHLVLFHPAIFQDIQARVKNLLAEIESQFPADLLEEIREKARAGELEKLVEIILENE